MNTAGRLICFVSACGSAAIGQAIPATTPAVVADVYVLSAPANVGDVGRITSFTAAANGHLTPTASPMVNSTADSLALNGKWLFTSDRNKQVISSYRIAANGSLSLVDQMNLGYQPNNVFLDHTGRNLYANIFFGSGYETFSIDQANGKLTSVNMLNYQVTDNTYLTFTGNNEYAYGATNYQQTATVNGFLRQADGSLTVVPTNFGVIPTPADPNREQYFAIDGGAADPYNDLVVAFQDFNFFTGQFVKTQLAVYTVDAFGNLTTTSTAANMASVDTFTRGLAMSPHGYYLAATGNGLQIFLMHGAKQVTALTAPILSNISMGRAFWDNKEHLYVPAADSLYVFSVGTSGVKQVPGSPFHVQGATNVIVLPKQ